MVFVDALELIWRKIVGESNDGARNTMHVIC